MFNEDLLRRLPLNIRELIESLTENEITVIKALSKGKFMRKSTFTEQTLRKELPPLKKDIAVPDVCKSLNRKGLFKLYRRQDNWKWTSKGLKVAEFFKRSKYMEYGMKILKHGMVF